MPDQRAGPGHASGRIRPLGALIGQMSAIAPSIGPAGRRLAARLALGAVLLLPAALTVVLSFHGGGFFPGAPAIIAAELAALIGLRAVLADRPFDGWGWALLVCAAALALLAGWTLLSADWSASRGRALLEYDRVLLYLLVLLAFGSLTRTARRVQVMTWGVAAAAVVVCAAAFASRTLPHLVTTSTTIHPDRLSYPVSYWNALGILAAVGIVLCGHLACSLREPRTARVLGAAAVPLLATTLLFTLSRAATIASLAAVIVYVVVGRPRGLLAGAIATVPATAVALMVANPPSELAFADPASARAAELGARVALGVGAAMLGAGLLRALFLPLDARVSAIRVSRTARRRLLTAAAVLGTGVFLAGAVALNLPGVAGNKYDEFTASASVGSGGTARLLSASSNGRMDHWHVALAGYRNNRWHGRGAGTYETLWNRERPTTVAVLDAHSLYLEALAELGWPGLVLVVAALLAILAAFAARARGPDRPLYAALLAAGIAWAVHAGVDWDWEMPAVSLWLFALGGLALARPPGRKSAPAPESSASASASAGRRTGIALRIAVVVGCVAVAVQPARIALSQSRLQDSVHAYAQGDCLVADSAARASLRAVDSRPEPRVVLGYCDLQRGRKRHAVAEMNRAVALDPQNWKYRYALALALASGGHDPRPAARAALLLNPKSDVAQQAVTRFARSSRKRWIVQARRTPVLLP
jgi:hypothetical protein